MTAATLLSRLDKVKPTGPGRWIARCPAHDDRGPSLSVRELDDGRVLLHDFGQECSVADIVAAVGLELSDLFPPRLEAPSPGKSHRERRPFPSDDAMRCLEFEGRLIHLAAYEVAAGKPLSPTDRARLLLAVERIGAALEACNG
jgi:hypothetical protein